jgi:hypothetical protein
MNRHSNVAREFGPHGINSNTVDPGIHQNQSDRPLLNNPAAMKQHDPERVSSSSTARERPTLSPDPPFFWRPLTPPLFNGVLLFVDGGQLA